jgi:hypothetical protein
MREEKAEMSQKECVSIECIFNDKLRKGLCVGVSQNTRTYSKDVIHMCWVTEKPSLNQKCTAEMNAQMTPKEAVGVGVGLIRASIIGESLLRRVEKKP